ncbi:hypothetical protein COCVIDRAFT_113360 [Bipolaris victoriae FI3]|uniref:Uncharacterized protein n=1 Tax=Bipolaris victoriae (strain FI3) TaxID=930091 RepID=W7E6T6_BIPV3|nr:hypothetical protein COCVIDRAFT_113360 [Bipolaris victoriae FI3]
MQNLHCVSYSGRSVFSRPLGYPSRLLSCNQATNLPYPLISCRHICLELESGRSMNTAPLSALLIG